VSKRKPGGKESSEVSKCHQVGTFNFVGGEGGKRFTPKNIGQGGGEKKERLEGGKGTKVTPKEMHPRSEKSKEKDDARWGGKMRKLVFEKPAKTPGVVKKEAGPRNSDGGQKKPDRKALHDCESLEKKRQTLISQKRKYPFRWVDLNTKRGKREQHHTGGEKGGKGGKGSPRQSKKKTGEIVGVIRYHCARNRSERGIFGKGQKKKGSRLKKQTGPSGNTRKKKRKDVVVKNPRPLGGMLIPKKRGFRATQKKKTIQRGGDLAFLPRRKGAERFTSENLRILSLILEDAAPPLGGKIK